jgi:hypothetical protein
MKVFVNKIYYLFILLLSDDRFAGTAPASGPPAPTAKTTSTSGLPINDYIYILILAPFSGATS